MHIQTHLMSGWCLANCFPLTPRERLFAMLASTLPDLDGLTLALGWDAYQEYHHVLAHNLPFALLLSALLCIFSTHRAKAFLLYLSLTHLHLFMDYFGSGPLWKIYYFYPFSPQGYLTDAAWEFYSWQNLSTAGAFLIWTLLLALRAGRTPLEFFMPNLDRQLVTWLREKLPRLHPVGSAVRTGTTLDHQPSSSRESSS